MGFMTLAIAWVIMSLIVSARHMTIAIGMTLPFALLANMAWITHEGGNFRIQFVWKASMSKGGHKNHGSI